MKRLRHILKQSNRIGDKIGTHEYYFRNEAKTGNARALPPKGKVCEPVYVEFSKATGKVENTTNNLRLYCYRANESVVILFNGDVKTQRLAQDCERVSRHFKTANTLSRLLDHAIITKSIKWINAFSDIEVEDDFLLERKKIKR